MTDHLRLAALRRLRESFPPECVGKLPRGNRELDYVGLAAVIDRLLEVDPEWNWRPVSRDEHAAPGFVWSADGQPVGLWIELTVLGVTRLGFGSVAAGAFEPEKQLISDALRNAAMRFGVALDLWSKAELESTLGEEHVAPTLNGQPATYVLKPAPPQPTELRPAQPLPSAPPSAPELEMQEQLAASVDAAASIAKQQDRVTPACPNHGEMTWRRAGKSARTGRAYDAFWSCKDRTCGRAAHPISPSQRTRLSTLVHAAGCDDDELRAMLSEMGIRSSAAVTDLEYDALCASFGGEK